MTDEDLDELRPSAFAVAYRMLGSVSEAEDVVQEGLLRLHRVREGGERLESPRAPVDRGRTTVARPPSLGAAPARNLRWRMVARAARDE
jgi:RNA polymerase sigma-70 factor (ECF subfamily)